MMTIEFWVVIAFTVAILGYGLSPLIGGYKPEKPMAAVKDKARNLAEFLMSRGVVLEEVENTHVIKTTHDGYDNAVKPQQCTGFISSPNSALRMENPDWSDRCRKKTTHPSGLCPQHRRQVR